MLAPGRSAAPSSTQGFPAQPAWRRGLLAAFEALRSPDADLTTSPPAKQSSATGSTKGPAAHESRAAQKTTPGSCRLPLSASFSEGGGEKKHPNLNPPHAKPSPFPSIKGQRI